MDGIRSVYGSLPTNRRAVSRSALVGWFAAFAVVGCMAPATGPVVQKRGVKRTYAVPNVKPVASPDGFRFTTPHFALEFAPEVVSVSGYQAIGERASRGLGAMISLESQFNFLSEVLGIEAPAVIQVFVAPNIQGNEHDAFTRTAWRTNAEGKVEYQIQVLFGAQSFKNPTVRAHEMTHAFTSVDGIPAWLAEGFAVLVEAELTGGAGWAKQNRSLRPLGFDKEGFNLIQTWRKEGSALDFRGADTYSYSYSIVATLRDRFGDPFWHTFYRLLREDVQANGVHEHSDEEIVALMSEAAGTDLASFFTQELRFKLDALPAPSSPPAIGEPKKTRPVEMPPLR